MIRLLLLSLAAILISCKSGNSETSSQVPPAYNVYFKKYLERQFDYTIPEEGHYFVVIPSKGCLNCAKDEVTELLALTEKPSVTIVVSGAILHLLPEALTESQEKAFKIDTLNNLDRLNMPFPDFTGIFKTAGGEVVETIPFSYQTYTEAFKKIE